MELESDFEKRPKEKRVDDFDAETLLEDPTDVFDLDAEEFPGFSLLPPLLKVDLVLREASFSVLEVAEKLLTTYNNQKLISLMLNIAYTFIS